MANRLVSRRPILVHATYLKLYSQAPLMPRLRRFYEILLLLKTVSLGALVVLSAILISSWLTKHRRMDLR
jgi:hypothetical protein